MAKSREELFKDREKLLQELDDAPPSSNAKDVAWRRLYKFDCEHWGGLFGDSATIHDERS